MTEWNELWGSLCRFRCSSRIIQRPNTLNLGALSSADIWSFCLKVCHSLFSKIACLMSGHRTEAHPIRSCQRHLWSDVRWVDILWYKYGYSSIQIRHCHQENKIESLLETHIRPKIIQLWSLVLGFKRSIVKNTLSYWLYVDILLRIRDYTTQCMYGECWPTISFSISLQVFALNFHVPVRWQEKLCWPLTSAFVKSPAVKYGDRLASSWSAFVCLVGWPSRFGTFCFRWLAAVSLVSRIYYSSISWTFLHR